MDSVVLLLNSDYEPLNVCDVRRAFRLLFVEKAEVIQYDHHEIRTPSVVYRAPSVIRLQHHIKRPRPRVRLSRREVFARDKHTCQYCGKLTHDLTLDHVVPRHRGGAHTWDNLVAACKACNHRKGGKALEEARMRLMRAPFEPRCDVYTLFTPYLADPRNEAWRDYLFYRPQLTPAAELAPPQLPVEVTSILERLWAKGQAALVVGGGVRDWLLGRTAKDWDVATDARPERMLELFPAGHYENKFGTVTVDRAQVTTFRRDHQYGDHRRPDTVTFTDSIEEDLARRDFTVNAIAWGRARGEGEPRWIDPTGGRADLDARVLRAVGDPERRFDEDALRLVRAARLAGQLSFAIEPATQAAMHATAALVGYVSRERLGEELRRMLRADPPSTSLRILAETGLLAHAFPLLDAQRGVAQDKRPGDDLWAHSLSTLDGSAALEGSSDRLRLAALLHDVGKPSTFADGHFVGHDVEGARLADDFLSGLAYGRRDIEPVARLIGQHMFQYLPNWSDAAVRRFIRRVGPDLVLDLLRLRQADNIGSGLPADAGRLAELRSRVAAVLERHEPLGLGDLAIDGHALTSELGLTPGPLVGQLLDHLLEFVLAEPARNSPGQLLDEARAELAR